MNLSEYIISPKSFTRNLNNITYTDYFYKLKMLATSRFEWENLPNGMDEKWIENFLFNHGQCVIYNDENRGLMVAECVTNGTVNNYNEPTVISPAGVDVDSRPLVVGQDCVLIRNNDDIIPTSFFVQLFAYRLSQVSRTIDVNVNAQKTPVLVVGTEKQKLTLKNVYTQWNGNEPVIFGDKSLDTTELKVLKTDAPIVFPQLQEQKQNIWNECLTFLGINNANTDKRERLITDEVAANNVHIDLSAECFLKSRQKAVEQINKLYKLNIRVKMREQDIIAGTEEEVQEVEE